MKTIRVACIITMIVAGVQPAYAEKPPAAPMPATGQTTSIAVGDDGDLQTGVPLPKPRFKDNNDGTVTDRLTGLVWLRYAACNSNIPWATALDASRLLTDGQCGLTDHSEAGDWRLPNVREMDSLIDYRFSEPAISNAAGTAQAIFGDPFTNDPRNACSSYWTSTHTVINGTAYIIIFSTRDERHEYGNPQLAACMWPVRDLKKHKGK